MEAKILLIAKFCFQKELKLLCRRGIPTQFRRDIWKHLVYHHVQDIMEEKGPHYFSNLVNNTHESQVLLLTHEILNN